MSIFSSVLQKVGPIAGAAAPFIPGVGGLIAGGLGAVGAFSSASDAAKKAQGKADSYTAMQQAQLQAMQALQGKLNPVLDSYIANLSNVGLQGYTGPDPYSTDAQSAQWNGYGEQTFGAADQGVASLIHDYAHNGIIGGTGIDHGISQIRSSASNALGGFRRDLSERGALAKQQQYLADQDARTQRMLPILQLLQGNTGAINQTLGGQQTIAQNNANAASGSLGAAMGAVLGQAGTIFGSKTKDPNAGNNRTQTNQPGGNPFQVPVTLPPWAQGGGNLSVGYNGAYQNPNLRI